MKAFEYKRFSTIDSDELELDLGLELDQYIQLDYFQIERGAHPLEHKLGTKV